MDTPKGGPVDDKDRATDSGKGTAGRATLLTPLSVLTTTPGDKPF